MRRNARREPRKTRRKELQALKAENSKSRSARALHPLRFWSGQGEEV
jgi:hypothetical protein